MLNVDEENYKEAVESSYKVSATPGISKHTSHCNSLHD
jgi:NEDD8-activating enzyme E1 regulatory subunit